jgi:polyhydroxyalkanoate synthesis regulator phasin
MNENVSELKGLIESGFKNVEAQFANVHAELASVRDEAREFRSSVQDEAREFRSDVTKRMDALKEDINTAHAQFEEVIDLLKFLDEGESPALVGRVSALELRVDILEKKKRR